jgi:hypothetical protein
MIYEAKGGDTVAKIGGYCPEHGDWEIPSNVKVGYIGCPDCHFADMVSASCRKRREAVYRKVRRNTSGRLKQ